MIGVAALGPVLSFPSGRVHQKLDRQRAAEVLKVHFAAGGLALVDEIAGVIQRH